MDKPNTSLTFLGAAGTVTGSKFLLTVGTRRILVDAGMFQGEKHWRELNWAEFPVDPASISGVLLTHAHMDHVGYLPALVKKGFRGHVWCTEGTRRLAEIVLRDAAFLQESEAEDANKRGYSKHAPALPLYTTEDVEATLPLFVRVEYDTDYDLGDGVVVRYTRAGHILGSACISVWTPTASVLFSGDLGRHDHPVLRPRDTPPGAGAAVIDSTYGGREHPESEGLAHEEFADVIRRTIQRGGSVLVPAFAVDRTEVVLKTLAEMREQGRIPRVPVYVNSPMAARALDVYTTLTDELRDDLTPSELVRFPDLREIRTTEESRELTDKNGHGPAIIISSSGMATGGRVIHHLEKMLPDPRNAVVLTGYQAVGTRGWQLVQGATQIKMRGRYVPVKAEVLQDREFSVHGDCSDLLDWIRDLDPKPEVVYCVHGEPDSTKALASLITSEFGIQAVVPFHGEVVSLDGVHTIPAPEKTVVPESAPAGVGIAPEPVEVAAAATGVAVGELPKYTVITGVSGPEFDRAVSDALARGYTLHGSPSLLHEGGKILVAQALCR